MADGLQSEGVVREGGMTFFRARFLESRLGVTDPHAALFVSNDVRRYAAAVYAADPQTINRSLARFQRFSERMGDAAGKIGQFLFLGAGYDTRALWLPEIVANGTRVIEVDLPGMMAQKIRVLGEHGVSYPERVVPLGLDLGSPDLRQRLQEAGFDPAQPTGMFIEGVTFHLPPETARYILDPARLGLARGSQVTFDYWVRTRVDSRNDLFPRVSMQRFALPDDPQALQDALERYGYGAVSIVPLSDMVSRLWPDQRHDQRDWYVVEATVA